MHRLAIALLLFLAACAQYKAADVDESGVPLHQAWKDFYQD